MKERLDVILVNMGYAASREKAKAIIMSGNVYVNGQKEDKAGTAFDTSKIMGLWKFPLDGKMCMDIGSSTGGFTDCMLQNGAKKVYSIDVGTNQLDWKLRSDERVVCMEQTNFRYVTRDKIPDEIDFASVDVSFISLTKILIPARNLLKDSGEMVCLIKPQFEAGREKVGKNGVVRDEATHIEVIKKLVDFAYLTGFDVMGLDFSPIKGPEGNIEYLLYIKKSESIDEAVSAMDEHEAEKQLSEIIENKSGLSEADDWNKKIKEIVLMSHKM